MIKVHKLKPKEMKNQKVTKDREEIHQFKRPFMQNKKDKEENN